MTIKGYIILGLVILVLILGTWLYIVYPSVDSDLLSERHKISMDSAHQVSVRQIRLSDSTNLIRERLRQENDRKATERERALKSTVNRQARSIATLKALRDTQGITPDTLSQAIEVTQDSTIQAQAAEIEALRVDGRAAKESFQASIAAIQAVNLAVIGESALKDVVISDQGKEIVKLKKGNKLWKGIAAAAFIWAVVENLK